MTERKPNVKVSDISPEMQNDALDIAAKAIKEHQMEKDIAARIKKEFDKRHGPTWQCIVGRSFGADVVHENKNFTYFYVGQDLHDEGARKAFAYDVLTSSSQQLFDDVLKPLLDDMTTAVQSGSELQGIVIVDGSTRCRRKVLLDVADGVLGRCIRCLQDTSTTPPVTVLRLGAVLVEEDGQLVDLLRETVSLTDEGAMHAEGDRCYCAASVRDACVVEEVREQRTAVTGATSVLLKNDPQLFLRILRHLDWLTTDVVRPVVYSLALEHIEPTLTTSARNTVLQFVSIPADSDAQGMDTTRHLLNSAAVLRCCAAPLAVTLSESPLLFLLKPALLAQQPAVWVSCFAPACVSGADSNGAESFDAAFRVAQTAAYMYSAAHKQDSKLASLYRMLGNDYLQGDNSHIEQGGLFSSPASRRSITKQADMLPVPAATDLINTPAEEQPSSMHPGETVFVSPAEPKPTGSRHKELHGLATNPPLTGALFGSMTKAPTPRMQTPLERRQCTGNEDGGSVRGASARESRMIDASRAGPDAQQLEVHEHTTTTGCAGDDGAQSRHSLSGLLEMIQCQQEEIAEYMATIHDLRERIVALEDEVAGRDARVDAMRHKIRDTKQLYTLPAHPFIKQRGRGRPQHDAAEFYSRLSMKRYSVGEIDTTAPVPADYAILIQPQGRPTSPSMPSLMRRARLPPALGTLEHGTMALESSAVHIPRARATSSRSLLSPATEPNSTYTVAPFVPRARNSTERVQSISSPLVISQTSHHQAPLHRLIDVSCSRPTFEDFMRTAPRYQLRYASSRPSR